MNRDANLASQAKYRRAHPDRAEASTKKWRSANVDRVRAGRRSWYRHNADAINAAKRERLVTDPKFAAKVRKRNKRYAANHRPQKNAAAKVWREANPERFRANISRWNASHPGVVSEHSRRRRARKLNAACEVIDFLDICQRDGWRCGICHKKVDARLKYPDPLSRSMDHIVPLAAGGAHVASNVQLAHLICNIRRSDDSGPPVQMRLV